MGTTHLSTSQALQLDKQLCFALYSSSLAMTKLYKPLLDELNLTYPQYVVMLALWEADDVGVSELGQKLYLDSGTLTPLLKRLETANLVKRVRDTLDERRVKVTLTSVGKALQNKALNIPTCLLEATQCSVEEVNALTDSLKNLRQRLLK